MLDTRLEKRLMFDLRSSWQARALAGTQDKLQAVVMSVLAHNYDEAMPVLMQVAFPGFRVGATPISHAIYCSAARIDKSGRVVADMVSRTGRKIKNSIVFMSELDMQNAFRRLADMMKLDDHERIEMFHAVQRWVVADRRLDPTMNPHDPDAKRLTAH